ncbi:hypothetical protein [Lewinella cohaerens]|nr:hypothetical protein [Lewinella cohaerens]
MHNKLLHRAFAQLGQWAYTFKVWWEDSVLSTLDRWADYFNQGTGT